VVHKEMWQLLWQNWQCRQLLTDFQNPFTGTLCRQFAYATAL